MTAENTDTPNTPGSKSQKKRLDVLRERVLIRQIVLKTMAETKIPAKEHRDAEKILKLLDRDHSKALRQFQDQMKSMGFADNFDANGNPVTDPAAETPAEA